MLQSCFQNSSALNRRATVVDVVDNFHRDDMLDEIALHEEMVQLCWVMGFLNSFLFVMWRRL